MVEFLQHLVQLSEKAACIARVFKPENGLFVLPVQEKTGEAKNTRFVQDFKTLADVLIQEVVRYDLTAEVGQEIYTIPKFLEKFRKFHVKGQNFKTFFWLMRPGLNVDL